VSFAQKFLNLSLEDIKVSKKSIEKTKFINSIRYITDNKENKVKGITRNQAVKALKIPSKYFIDRGFSHQILARYDVGECFNPNKEMYNRAVVPIYDDKYEYMIGCTGRSIFEKCDKCSAYHNPNEQCPEPDNLWKFSKWRHSYKFKTQEHLYNMCFAKKHIKEMRSAVIVESPGNVWRLEEAGIHNSVAIFGSSLADRQKLLLDMSGAMSLILIMDNDQAGKKAREQITKKCSKIYNIYNIDIPEKDIACMSIDQIQAYILPKIKGLNT
jgi:5S rRNA maturation endonuclease (ribonuclease M5)